MIKPDSPSGLAIVGTTASGKSQIALSVAKNIGKFELVSLDSMQIYQGMDIGTAKPTQEEQSLIPHHMINIAQPDEEYTISQFQIEAKEAILLRTEKFLFDNCQHEWEKDFNETPVNATVKISAFKVCKKCGIMRRF